MNQELLNGKIVLQWWLLWQKANVPFGFFGMLTQIDPFNEYFSMRLLDNTAHDIHNGGFARAISAEQSVNAIFSQLKINVAYGPLHTVLVGQAFDTYNRFVHIFFFYFTANE
jgi:hypothetical protein